MLLERLELVDFRAYAAVDVPFQAGPNVLVGRNAEGKTNVLEAIYYLATGSSHRTSSDTPLVRAGAEAAIIRAHARSDAGRQVRVEYELRRGGRSRSRVGGQAQPRVRDALGQIRAVLFAPEDVQLVRGDPSDRRRFLDELLTQRRPAYHAARQEYDRVLRQRNALLRSARGPSGPSATLDTWTDALVAAGSAVLAARIASVHALAGPAASAYADLVGAAAGPSARVQLAYQLSTGRSIVGDPDRGVPDPAELAKELRTGLDERHAAELERGVTLAGPHRDDLALSLAELPAKGFASHGEMWSLVLALRLASREVLFEVGDEPVVLLDDVFAELDEERRRRLAARCDRFGQVLVTAAVDGDVPLDGPRYAVRDRTIIPPPELVEGEGERQRAGGWGPDG
ncbi:MAG: DNA replication/repair protein RecF [Actinobacteria bacterium]|nr:DNA replication/repair protein RecF [Actinomycetota bacterium]